MNPNTLTVIFVQLKTWAYSMHKIAAMYKELEDTESQLVAPGEN